MSIPKIIHQSWKDNHSFDRQWKGLQAICKDLHSDWEYIFWTDEMNRNLISDSYPQYLLLYDNFEKNIMRADFARYAYMHKIGGVYLDLDYEFTNTFDDLDYKCVLPISREENHKDGFRLGNCILASQAGVEFWIHLMDEIKNKELFPGMDVEEATGPKMLTDAYRSFDNKINIHLPKRMKYHPPTPKSKKEYEFIIANNMSSGIHHCSGTWRDSWIDRVINKYQWRKKS